MIPLNVENTSHSGGVREGGRVHEDQVEGLVGGFAVGQPGQAVGLFHYVLAGVCPVQGQVVLRPANVGFGHIQAQGPAGTANGCVYGGCAGVAEQVQEAFAPGMLLYPVAHRAVIQEQAGVQVVFQVYFQGAAVFVHVEVFTGCGLFFILLGAGLALALFTHQVFRRNFQHFRDDRHGFAETFPGGFFVYRFRGQVFLHMHPALVDIDSQGVLRHVRIVQAVAANVLFPGPLADGFQVFLQPVAQHVCPLGIGDPGHHLARRCRVPGGAGIFGLDFEQQQLCRQLAVEEFVLLEAAQTDGLSELRSTGKHCQAPAGQLTQNHFAKSLVKACQFFALAQAFAVWRVGQHQALFGPAFLPFKSGNRPNLNLHKVIQAGPADVVSGGIDNTAVLVETGKGRYPFLFAFVGAALRFLA